MRYKVISFSATALDTENKMNVLAKEGWEFVCVYAKHFMIMQKEK